MWVSVMRVGEGVRTGGGFEPSQPSQSLHCKDSNVNSCNDLEGLGRQKQGISRSGDRLRRQSKVLILQEIFVSWTSSPWSPEIKCPFKKEVRSRAPTASRMRLGFNRISAGAFWARRRGNPADQSQNAPAGVLGGSGAAPLAAPIVGRLREEEAVHLRSDGGQAQVSPQATSDRGAGASPGREIAGQSIAVAEDGTAELDHPLQKPSRLGAVLCDVRQNIGRPPLVVRFGRVVAGLDVDLVCTLAPSGHDLLEPPLQLTGDVHQDMHVLLKTGAALGLAGPDACEVETVVPGELRQLVPPHGPGLDALPRVLIIDIAGPESDEAVHGLADASGVMPRGLGVFDLSQREAPRDLAAADLGLGRPVRIPVCS
ncbi:hypothetical protein CDS [Bradyrhizobium sp.]|nr:hypothetical protein CDS [Bradyrhizobium sp.]